MSYQQKVITAIARRGRLCVGIDPHPALLDAWGLPRSGEGVAQFGLICAAAFADEVGFVKPQVAFFEAYGAAGYTALAQVLSELRNSGSVVIADAKRGDIGSTMAGYAQAWLGAGDLSADAVTLSPYLGFESLRPALDLAVAHDRGLFVLARTSNPEGRVLQERVAQTEVVDAARASNAQTTAAGGVGLGVGGGAGAGADFAATVGLVVGATGPHGLDLAGLGGPILAPGLGAQGASAADLKRIFAGTTQYLLPTASRAVLAAGPDVAALRTAALTLRDEVERTLGAA